MNTHILKIIWNQRRSNGWIFTELVLVLGALWIMMDVLITNYCVYQAPLGYDISDVYVLELGELGSKTPGFVTDELRTTTEADDLHRIVDNLRQSPQIESAAIVAYATPYSRGIARATLIRADADTALKNKADVFRNYMVTPEYFDVLRILDRAGKPIRPQLENTQASYQIVISADMEDKFFPGESGRGKKVSWGYGSTDELLVATTSVAIRKDEFESGRPCFYQVRSGNEEEEWINENHAANMQCLIRMRSGFKEEEMEHFLQRMSDRLQVNNLYVFSATPLTDYRTDALKNRSDAMKKKLVLVAFMLVNVFFGIVGTFWLRLQYRRGEMGLRAALGASRAAQQKYLNTEALFLLAMTVPLVLFFILNTVHFDLPDTANLPFTWWRFLTAFFAALLLLAGMILVGIWFPARQIAKMNPADALHYE